MKFCWGQAAAAGLHAPALDWATPPTLVQEVLHVTTLTTADPWHWSGVMRPWSRCVSLYVRCHGCCCSSLGRACLPTEQTEQLQHTAPRQRAGPPPARHQRHTRHYSYTAPADHLHEYSIQTEYKKNIHVDGNQGMNLSDVLSLATCAIFIRAKEFSRTYSHS